MSERCRWTSDEDGTWFSGCGEAFVFESQGPMENGFRFCPYCGGTVEQVAEVMSRIQNNVGAPKWFAALLVFEELERRKTAECVRPPAAARAERAELMRQAKEARESGTVSGRRLARRLAWMADMAGMLGRIAGRLEGRECSDGVGKGL